MPKGIAEDGSPILTKEEFMEAMLMPRGYEKVNGEWVLTHPELNNVIKPKKDSTPKTTKQEKVKPVITGSLTKEIIAKNISDYLESNDYSFTMEKSNFLVASGNDKYEIKIVKKSAAFTFLGAFHGVKDLGKQKFINQILELDFCNIGVMDAKGIVGLTNGKDYFAITITKKRG